MEINKIRINGKEYRIVGGDYVLTDQDKQEIIDLVGEAFPNAGQQYPNVEDMEVEF